MPISPRSPHKCTPRVPSYRRHKPTGQAVVTLNGQDLYLGRWNSRESRAEYDRLIGEWLASGRSHPRLTSDLTVAELILRYWRFAKGYYVKNGEPSGWQVHIRLVLRRLKESYGPTLAVEFGPLALKAFRQRLIGEGHSRKYINKLVAIIPRMFKWAASEQLVPGGVYQDLRTVEGLRKGRCDAPDHPPVPPVTDAIVEATLPWLPAVVADMVRLQRLTGARPSEVCSIRPCDVDRSRDVWVYRPKHHKTEHQDRERVVFLGPKAQDVLRPYLLRDSEAYCFSPADSESRRKAAMRERRKTRVQPSQMNRCKARPERKPRDHYTKDSYNRAVGRACQAAFGMPSELRRIRSKGPDGQPLPEEQRERLRAAAAAWRAQHCWSPNQLRHAAATEIRRQFGLEAAQVALGHSTAVVTQIYAQRDRNLAEEVARRIG